MRERPSRRTVLDGDQIKLVYAASQLLPPDARYGLILAVAQRLKVSGLAMVTNERLQSTIVAALDEVAVA